MTEAKRLDLFTRVLAAAFILCLFFAGKLWLSSRLYPLVPLLPFVPPLPFPVDYLAFAALVTLLASLIAFPRSKRVLGALLVVLGVLFIQDQSRLWPSFYEFTFLLLILMSFRRGTGDDEREASRVLNAGRFVLAAVYFWSGFLKYTPRFFYTAFPWFFSPVTAHVPAVAPFMPALAVVAVVIEISFALGLLTRFRKVAFWEATLMHAMIFFLLGPLRGNWNDSAWMWSAATVSFLWTLYFRAPPFSWRMLFALDVRKGLKSLYALPTLLAVLFIGILPVLNEVNVWDSALSFNVYTDNIAAANVYMTSDVAARLPAGLAPFMTKGGSADALDVTAWAEHEFNAGPYSETRIFLAIFRSLCPYASASGSMTLAIAAKGGWFIPPAVSYYSCGAS
ncbi:MAG TPA: hypothetical protein VMV50_00390 [Candidatus Paceibacterota bacterium]|nr:hypothetical protein [Candidatus Paceibacterota bacterium]